MNKLFSRKEYKEFECSYCGCKWNSTSWKRFDRKYNDKSWTEYKSICPKCKREVTELDYTKGDRK